MADDQTLIQIRERSFLDVLDLALVVIRRRPLTLGLAAVAGVAPCIALNARLTSVPEFNSLWYVYLLAIEAPWATAPLTVVLGALMFGQRPTPWGVFKTLVKGLPALFLYQFLLRIVLIVFPVLYPIVPTRLAFLNEVILLERGRTLGVIRRTSTLCGTRGGDLFGQWIAQILFGLLFVTCFWFGTGSMISALMTSEVTWDRPELAAIYGQRFQVGVWLSITFFGVARFLTYIDHRIRLEGWEVRLRLRAVGRQLEEAARW